LTLLTFHCTGDQAQLFGGVAGTYHAIKGMEAHLTALGGSGRYLSATNPRRLLQAGWYALAFDSGVAGLNAAYEWTWLEFEYQYKTFPSPFITVDRLVSHCEPGTTMDVILTY
jgi:hypothetical protein